MKKAGKRKAASSKFASRPIQQLQPDKPFPEEGIEGIVVRHAQNLRNHATDVLRGDFSVFEDLDRIVKGRARDFAIEEWGEQKARELGWS